MFSLFIDTQGKKDYMGYQEAKPPCIERLNSMEQQRYLEIMRRHLQESYLLDSGQVAEILPRFLVTLFQYMHNLEMLQQAGDPAALGKASHAVRGALLNLGLLDLADFARQVEEHCADPSGLPVCCHLLKELKQQLNSLKELTDKDLLP